MVAMCDHNRLQLEADHAIERREYQRLTERRAQLAEEMSCTAHMQATSRQSCEQLSRNLESYTTPPEVESHVARQLELIAKLPFVEKVSVRNGNIQIATNLLFTNIRTGDGARETARRCIGAYLITIQALPRDFLENSEIPFRNSVSGEKNQKAILLRQLLFTTSETAKRYAHWSTKHCIPCFGDYTDSVREQYMSGDYVGLLQSLYSMLRAAKYDSGAWRKSHNWMREIHDSYTKAPSFVPDIDEIVYMRESMYENAYFHVHEPLRVVYNQGDSIGIEVQRDSLCSYTDLDECGHCTGENEDAEDCYCATMTVEEDATEVVGHSCNGHGAENRCYFVPAEMLRRTANDDGEDLFALLAQLPDFTERVVGERILADRINLQAQRNQT